MSNEFCVWKYDDDETGAWITSCDHAFEFITDGPGENGFKWCPYCGKRVKEK